MSKIIPLGAINRKTQEYVYPKVANKKDEYICPDCNNELILCKGEIRIPHFRHKVDNINPCHHYSNPTESQIHKDAKILLKNLLQRKIPTSFIRECCSCKKMEEFEIPEISESSTIELEYRFQYNGSLQVADVAYLNNGEIVALFEIWYTHKTRSEKRPEPWFEIDAEKLIRLANDDSLTTLQIQCIRCEKCEECTEMEKIKQILIKKQLDKELLGYYLSYLSTSKDYPKLFNENICKYIEDIENKNKNLLDKPEYIFYKSAILSIHKYFSFNCLPIYYINHISESIDDNSGLRFPGVSSFESKCWNKQIKDINLVNRFIKKNELVIPHKLCKKIILMEIDRYKSYNCKICNRVGYCICNLNKFQLKLLTIY